MATRKEKVICVRIAQHKLRHPKHNLTYDYFPYDRVYLAREKLAPIFRKTFRYYLSMPLDKELLNALNGMKVEQVKESTVIRDEHRREGTPGLNHDNFTKLIRNHRGSRCHISYGGIVFFPAVERLKHFARHGEIHTHQLARAQVHELGNQGGQPNTQQPTLQLISAQ